MYIEHDSVYEKALRLFAIVDTPLGMQNTQCTLTMKMANGKG